MELPLTHLLHGDDDCDIDEDYCQLRNVEAKLMSQCSLRSVQKVWQS